MGLRPFSKPPKSPSSVVDPPVFNHKGDDCLKGHKAPGPKKENSFNGKNNSNTQNSTALWIASANASANRKNASSHSVGSELEGDEGSSYYEEEIIEEEYEEEEIVEDSLPPRKITIRFDEYDEMQTVLHINDYSNHEISKAWYKRTDYDKMVTLARKTAEKVEERRKDISKMDSKSSRKIESRGLEAWTSFGAAKVRLLKESAVEAVWNEQSRQWDLGIHDADRLREAYIKISKGAQAAAEDRGFSDFLIAKRIREIELEEEEKKRRRKLLGKGKALVGKSIKKTAGGVVKTAKLGVKTTRFTGKVALKTGKVATKTAVATATLDRKMLKEAIIPERKKKSFTPEVSRQVSRSQMEEQSDHVKKDAPHDDDGESDAESHDDVASEGGKKKKSKLKLLGVVPIPGTHKTYREDRRLKELEKRQAKSMRPSWEQGLSAGKY
mmetsp:Transcript_1331/g.1858  ORF Transcript_1331/g.1858 Transcript_1331/m.1858 type:complete len:440 (+) Transcript_1331:303-1622(+)|eukprot:CAMPEP_0117026554 /NCGR_PEP_ID=MMETSP0472-20121206/19507_1 /TAXON_ID=693140 ORGANISM="Tiarina fusus, Strain LIS" /NCGR_SAMPLE_ID=MMETSP0472 /ASSEMBLY_ACC=CAM_ASM_000603 /LENGTH=439 /DNA_ID=CAMNT_0004733585 /DNA_START=290 /DNA_END=1609 /DNA_ORIENTATION=-